jgi:hypothetical protein
MMRAAARAVASAVGSAVRIDVLRLIDRSMGGGAQGDKRDIGNRASEPTLVPFARPVK